MSRPRHAMATGDGTRRSVTLLITLALLAGGMLVAEAASPLSADGAPEPAEVERGQLALSHCPVVTGDDDQASVTVAAVGEEASGVTVLRHSGEGDTEVIAERGLDPGQRATIELDGGEPVTVRSRGGDVDAVWSVSGERSATGPCADTVDDQYYLAGLDSSLGSAAQLHLFNPFTIDAVVQVRFATAEGLVDLVSTESVAIEAGGVHTLDLTELQPEEPELGVIVQTVTGRVVAQGEVERTRTDADDHGPEGRALVPASTELSDGASFAYAVDGDEWSSRLAIMNPNDREAAVRVHASNPDPDAPVEEVSVPAGGVARVDLGGRSASRTFALSVESLNELPLLVSRVESSTGDTASLAVPTGAQAPSSRWVSAGPTGERSDVLSVYNPGEEPVEVTATLAGTPVVPWQRRPLGPGEQQLLHVEDAEGDWPAVIEADGPVVTEVISAAQVPEAAEEEAAEEDAEEEEAEEEEAEEEPVEDREPPPSVDLARVIGLARPAETPAPVVSVPQVRLDQSLPREPVVLPEEEEAEEESDTVVDPDDYVDGSDGGDG